MDPSTLVSGRNLALAAAIVVVLSITKQQAPGLFETRVGQRLLPALPILLAVGLSFCGFADPTLTLTWQATLVTGLLTGAVASSLYKVSRTSILGLGVEAPASEAKPVAAPAAPPGGA